SSAWLLAYAALSVNHLLSARKQACSPLIFSFRLIVTHNGHDGLLTKTRFANKKDKNHLRFTMYDVRFQTAAFQKRHR
ncbi:MAG: hypothetical protein UIB40_04720, partial [Paludibacteraceae bacterium]|nr:hypothetical protein [Paludibacteraceae bacterium]